MDLRDLEAKWLRAVAFRAQQESYDVLYKYRWLHYQVYKMYPVVAIVL